MSLITRRRVLALAVLIALAGGGTLAAFGIPELRQRRRWHQERKAIATLRAIAEAEEAVIRSQIEAGVERPRFLELDELVRAHLVSAELATGTRQGYTFVVRRVLDPNISGYYTLADPDDPEERHYYALNGGYLYSAVVPIPVDPQTGQMRLDSKGGGVAGCSSSHAVTEYRVPPYDAD